MTELYESGFGFGSHTNKESATFEMVEEASSEDFEEFEVEISAPAPEPEPNLASKASATPVSKYALSKRPMRAKKRR